MTLDPNNVPAGIATIIPFAEKWGIGDDFDREDAISKASLHQLEKLAHCLDRVDDKTLVDWLTGSESKRTPPSDEYLAITCLTMAVHSAKVKLKKRRKHNGPNTA